MKTNLYIPKKIRIGFQKRKDTFNGKLAYVICFDEKGNLRKETSWEGWRDQDIPYIDLDNKPVSGFMFNKGIDRYGYFGSGRSVIRVHHPDEFEFEISVENLIGLLMNTDVSKRYIHGECVFAWAGKDLVLLPVNSVEYQEALKYTEKQSDKITTKELQKGFKYTQKKSNEELTYLGYFEFVNSHYFHYSYTLETLADVKSAKKHVFYDENKKFVTPSVSTLSKCVSVEPDQNYHEVLDYFLKSKNSSKLSKIVLEKPNPKDFIESKYDSNRIIQNYGENDIFIIEKYYQNFNFVSYNKTSKRIEGVNFYWFNLANGARSYRQNYNFSSKLSEKFISIFPELLHRDIPLDEFIDLAGTKGFKEVYLTTDVEGAVKYRL